MEVDVKLKNHGLFDYICFFRKAIKKFYGNSFKGSRQLPVVMDTCLYIRVIDNANAIHYRL